MGRRDASRLTRRPPSAETVPGELPIDKVIQGDCLHELARFPEQCVDLVFADPPYNLQLSHDLYRPNQTRVEGVNEAWDRFASFAEYDEFTRAWLTLCRRVLKPDGSLWVIGSYHNIFRVGAILQDLGFWILNDVVWVKTNPMPNFRGVRFTNAHETLIWASRERGARYRFDHQAMRSMNDDLQMRSDWLIPVCGGPERLRRNGAKLHPTQKPEALLHRVLLAASQPGDVVLDPFFGTGTTGVVAARLGRRWIGIERDRAYVEAARNRLARESNSAVEPELVASIDPSLGAPRVSVGDLVANGLLSIGQRLYFRDHSQDAARVRADGRLTLRGEVGSIHQLGRTLSGGRPCNGWTTWTFAAGRGPRQPLEVLRTELRRRLAASNLEDAGPGSG